MKVSDYVVHNCFHYTFVHKSFLNLSLSLFVCVCVSAGQGEGERAPRVQQSPVLRGVCGHSSGGVWGERREGTLQEGQSWHHQRCEHHITVIHTLYVHSQTQSRIYIHVSYMKCVLLRLLIHLYSNCPYTPKGKSVNSKRCTRVFCFLILSPHSHWWCPQLHTVQKCYTMTYV